jgi:hypothetical protein
VTQRKCGANRARLRPAEQGAALRREFDVPRVAAYLRELVRGSRNPAVADFEIHGTFQGDDDAQHYSHLFADDHSEAMTALGAMSRPASPNVVPLRRRG